MITSTYPKFAYFCDYILVSAVIWGADLIIISKYRSFIYAFLGHVFFRKGQYDRAIEVLTKAIEIDPGLADAYFNRGTAYENLGENEKAISDYSKMIEIDPMSAIAYSNRGASYQLIGKHKQAVSDFSKAIKIDPEHWTAYFNRADVYRLMGENEKACSDLKRLCELGFCEPYDKAKKDGVCQ